MANLDQIVEELSALTVLEAADLSKMLEEKWGVSAAAPVAVAASGGGEAVAAEEEKDTFDVVLTGFGEKKNQCHQGSSRHHRAWSEGSQGPCRGRTKCRQGRHQQGRSWRNSEEAGRSRSNGRNQIMTSLLLESPRWPAQGGTWIVPPAPGRNLSARANARRRRASVLCLVPLLEAVKRY